MARSILHNNESSSFMLPGPDASEDQKDMPGAAAMATKNHNEADLAHESDECSTALSEFTLTIKLWFLT